MKPFKHFKTVTVLALALIMALLVPMQTLAAANNGKYVSEVYVAYGKDADAAQKVLTDKGFTPVEGNLNDSGDTYVMLGYKTTDNIRDSITDIAVMNMDGDFSTTRYNEILKEKKVQVAEMMEDFMAAIMEYRANLKAGKAKATVVHDILNKLTDDDTGMKLGDLLNSETLQDKVGIKQSINHSNPDKLPDLLTIFMQGNSYLISMVETLLAISADAADNTWIDRFAELDYDSLLDRVEDERPDLNTETKRVQYLDNEYGDIAAVLAPAAAELRADLIGYEQTGLDITKATEEDINNTFGDPDALEDEAAKATIVNKIIEWSETGIIYEHLKNYEGGSFNKGELLDFFKEEVDENETERYYPIAASLSDGQRGGMEFITLRSLIRYTCLDPEELEKEVNSNSALSKMDNESVYKGINRDLFKTDSSIAYTTEATRNKNTASPEFFSDEWLVENSGLLGMWLATVLCGLGWLRLGNYAAALAEDMSLTGIAGAENNLVLSVYAGEICKYACIFFGIIAAGMTIYRIVHTEDVKLEPIPRYFVDTKTTEDGSSYELYYEAAQCNRADYNKNNKQSGSSADICADEGRQWLALYVSKNSMAGNPVTPDFKVEAKPDASGGRKGSVHLFREKGAVNLAKSEYRNYSSLYSAYSSIKNLFTDDYAAYVFYQRSDTAKTYDESAGNMTATAMSGGIAAVFGFGGVALGAVLGAVIATAVSKKKKAAV